MERRIGMKNRLCTKAETRVWDFDNDKPGEIAEGFSNQFTGKGGPGKWEVIKDDTATSTVPMLLPRHLRRISVIISVWRLMKNEAL